MLNAMMENENRSFTTISIFYEIIVAEHGVCDHDLRKEVRILVKNFFSIVAFNRFNYKSR